MSNDNWNDEFNDDSFDSAEQPQRRPRPQAKQGMSTGIKVLLILLAIFGVGALACCGVGVFFVYKFVPEVSESPADVIATQKQMVDITLLPELKPKMSISMDNFAVQSKMVIFGSDDDKSTLTMLQIKLKVGDDAQQEAQIREVMEEQGRTEDTHLASKEVETRKIKVKGLEEEFQFVTGEDPGTGKKMHQVIGSFPGNGGDVQFVYQADEEAYKEEDVIKMIESVQ